MLNITYLGKITIAEHGGVVRQILGKLKGAPISNEMFTQRLNDVDATAQVEDDAYTRSLKDFNVDRLKNEDDLTDHYVKATRAILGGHTQLPESEPNYQKARELVQVFKDYDFSPSDTYTAEAEKIRNMNQIFQTRLADLQTLGVADYWAKTVEHALNMEQLLSQRFDDVASRVVGETKTARANTDQAIKAMYELLAAMNVMMPSAELSALISQLDAIEAYANQYYLGKGGSNGTGKGSNNGSNSGTNSGAGTGSDAGTGTGSGSADAGANGGSGSTGDSGDTGSTGGSGDNSGSGGTTTDPGTGGGTHFGDEG